jgi:hypothetical protein
LNLEKSARNRAVNALLAKAAFYRIRTEVKYLLGATPATADGIY